MKQLDPKLQCLSIWPDTDPHLCDDLLSASQMMAAYGLSRSRAQELMQRMRETASCGVYDVHDHVRGIRYYMAHRDIVALFVSRIRPRGNPLFLDSAHQRQYSRARWDKTKARIAAYEDSRASTNPPPEAG